MSSAKWRPFCLGLSVLTNTNQGCVMMLAKLLITTIQDGPLRHQGPSCKWISVPIGESWEHLPYDTYYMLHVIYTCLCFCFADVASQLFIEECDFAGHMQDYLIGEVVHRCWLNPGVKAHQTTRNREPHVFSLLLRCTEDINKDFVSRCLLKWHSDANSSWSC